METGTEWAFPNYVVLAKIQWQGLKMLKANFMHPEK